MKNLIVAKTTYGEVVVGHVDKVSTTDGDMITGTLHVANLNIPDYPLGFVDQLDLDWVTRLIGRVGADAVRILRRMHLHSAANVGGRLVWTLHILLDEVHEEDVLLIRSLESLKLVKSGPVFVGPDYKDGYRIHANGLAFLGVHDVQD